MELTQQHFDEQIKKLATKDDLKGQTKILSEQIEELARMTKDGFDDVLERLNYKERVQKLEKEMKELKTALHLS